MAKVWQNPNKVYDRVFHVSRESADETLGLIQRKLRAKKNHPYATGRLAASYHIETEEVTSEHVSMFIVSTLPYANAIEEGAWVKGRGPHISRSGKGRYEVRKTGERDFGRRMTKKLRAGS